MERIELQIKKILNIQHKYYICSVIVYAIGSGKIIVNIFAKDGLSLVRLTGDERYVDIL